MDCCDNDGKTNLTLPTCKEITSVETLQQNGIIFIYFNISTSSSKSVEKLKSAFSFLQ